MHPLAITIGDAAGIGPEVVLAALPHFDPDHTPLAIYATPRLLELTWRALAGRRSDLADPHTLTALPCDQPWPAPDGRHWLIDVSARLPPRARADVDRLDHIPFGTPVPAFGHLQGIALEAAIDDTLRGATAGICTAPLTKSLFLLAGRAPTGHTELLAERTGAPHHVMMLAGDKLRVALVTTHLPLRDVADALSIEGVLAVLRTTATDLRRRFGLQHPRLAVAALNPHAGEAGTMGTEERDILQPAIHAGRQEGIDVHGPFPADTLFAPLGRPAAPWPWDAVVCMYHDQGLIPLKLAHFGQAANITLGLPLVRTSVDHGTAWDIAGTGNADASSMIWATELALHLVANAC